MTQQLEGISRTCKRCFKEITNGNYQRANGKTIHNECFNCEKCSESMLDTKYYEKDNHHYCHTCILSLCDKCSCGCGNPLIGKMIMPMSGQKYLEGHFKCFKCQGEILGKDFFKNNEGKPQHRECTQTTKQCGFCKLDIKDAFVSALGRDWHAHCFRCQECNVQLHSAFSEANGDPMCNPCKQGRTTKVDYGKQKREEIKTEYNQCAACNKDITEAELSTDGKIFHPECFKCADCDKEITGQFGKRSNQYICKECNLKAHGQKRKDSFESKTCEGCKNTIDDEVLTTGDKHYHPWCFKCSGCSDAIQGSYAMFEGKPLCDKCGKNKKEQKSSPRQTDDLKTCAGCNQKIQGEATLALGCTYHLDCFKCCVCHEKISGSFSSRNGQPACTQCTLQKKQEDNASQATYCGECTKVISGQSLEAEGKRFHPDCFKCSECHNKLEGPYAVLDNKLICKSCGEKQVDKKHVEAFPNCEGCGKQIAGQATVVGDKKYHPECFACFNCKDKIQGQYGMVNGKVHCKKCQQEAHKRKNEELMKHLEEEAKDEGNICNACNKVIMGKVLETSESKFHPECFVCGTCKKPITSQYAEDDGKFICQNCNLEKRQKTPLQDVNEKQPSSTTIDKRDTCTNCNEKISGFSVEAFGKQYHQDCFKCQDCKQPLKEKFHNFKEHIFCLPCYDKALDKKKNFAEDGSKCVICDFSLQVGEKIEALGHFYHRHCFKCNVCHLKIDGDNWTEVLLKPVCNNCHTKRVSETPQLGGVAAMRANFEKNKK